MGNTAIAWTCLLWDALFSSSSRVKCLSPVIVQLASTRWTWRSIFPDRWPKSAPGTELYDLGVLMSNLLAIDPSLRPSAGETLDGLHSIRNRLELCGKKTTDPFFHVEDRPNRTPHTVPASTVNPALRFIGSQFKQTSPSCEQCIRTLLRYSARNLFTYHSATSDFPNPGVISANSNAYHADQKFRKRVLFGHWTTLA